jgi:hypothetical protein
LFLNAILIRSMERWPVIREETSISGMDWRCNWPVGLIKRLTCWRHCSWLSECWYFRLYRLIVFGGWEGPQMSDILMNSRTVVFWRGLYFEAGICVIRTVCKGHTDSIQHCNG